MSILLNALKKSETQRQLGKTPTIHTALEAPDVERQTEQQWIILSMLAVSAVAIAWFGWQQFREPVDATGVDVLAITQVEVNPALAEDPERGGMERTPSASLSNEKKSQTDSTIHPVADPVEAMERRARLSQSFSSYQAEKDTATGKEADLPPTTVAQPVAEAAPVATPAKRSTRSQPHQSEPISFWQIPQALREGLPEFRINVLVYAEKPQDRFLLINGQRLVEKEELAAGVILDEIRRDGAVFRYRNYRFLVKG